jgi:hypothetical protein
MLLATMNLMVGQWHFCPANLQHEKALLLPLAVKVNRPVQLVPGEF